MNPSSAAFFEARYRRHADPWDFAGAPYERNRYQCLLDAIGDGPFQAAFEPGCSVGVFTELLAPRCRRLVATDLSPTAVAAAARRCAPYPSVRVELGALPAMPDGPFDLIVFSEIGYYFERDGLAEVIERLTERLAAGGRLAGTHWTGHSPDHRLHADDVHAALEGAASLETVQDDDHDGFRLGLWRAR